MCGRTACTLPHDDILKACSYRDRKGKRRRPQWKDAPGGHQYKTSYNMAPGSFSPVIVSSKHFPDVVGQPDVDHVVMPMKWGLVPGWHKDSPTNFSLKTSNCRGESMLDKATFKIPLQQGRRCVAVMDGFYEWKTTASGKQPYFFQLTPGDIKLEDKKSIMKNDNSLAQVESFPKCKMGDHPLSTTIDDFKQEKMETKLEHMTDDKEEIGFQNLHGEGSGDTDAGQSSLIRNDITKVVREDNKSRIHSKLLACAAVYDVWQPADVNAKTPRGPPLYSYSIITVAASKDMSWCHHRMPAVLRTDEEVCDWLDFSTVPLTEANSLIQSKSNCLTSHPVSKNVNNSHYQSQDCLQPIDIHDQKKKLSGSGKMMMNWLKRGTTTSNTHPNSSSSKAAKI